MAYLVFLTSTACHEAAHAWAALKLGDDTAYRGGQVTLDPTPHVKREPFGMVVVPLASFLLGGSMIGWASCPYNPAWALTYPRRSAAMAMAGPAANLLIVLLAFLLMRAGIASGFFEETTRVAWGHLVTTDRGMFWPFIADLLGLYFSMNLLLGLFNLIPLPPLDGSSIPLLFLPDRAARGYIGLQSGLGFIGLFIAWKVFDGIFPPVWRAVAEIAFGR